MVPAHVEKAAQDPVLAAHDDDRLAGEQNGDVLARLRELIESPDHLPGAGEDGPALELGDALVHVPRRRDRPGLLQRGLPVVGLEDLLD